jgi:hypothetical protein
MFNTNQQKDMTISNKPFANFRDALLSIEDVDGINVNAFGYALRLCISLRLNVITLEQWDGLCAELKFHCEKEGIETSNEIASLF